MTVLNAFSMNLISIRTIYRYLTTECKNWVCLLFLELWIWTLHSGLKGTNAASIKEAWKCERTHNNDLGSELKSLEVTVSETFLVHLALNSLPRDYTKLKVT